MDWARSLDASRTVEEVLESVEEFLASRSDIYWTGVPPDLRSPTIADEHQLQRWHHALVQAISNMPSPGTPMQELAVFSLRAGVRIHQIRLREDPEAPSNDRQFSALPLRPRRVRTT
jgi:hypothetical protein